MSKKTNQQALAAAQAALAARSSAHTFGGLASSIRAGYPEGVFDTRNFTDEQWLQLLHYIEKEAPEVLNKFNSPLYKML